MSRTVCLYLTIISFLVACWVKVPAKGTDHTPLTKALKDSLRNEIEAMLKNDQKYRWMIQFGETDENKLAELRKMSEADQFQRMKAVQDDKVGIAKKAKDSLWQMQAAIDSSNFVKMKGIIYTYGYPKKYMEAYKVSVIFIHARPQWMTADFFRVLKEEVMNGNMPAFEYAAIYDRMQIENKLPELYYVSEHYDAKTGKSAIGKPLNMEATNKAREEIGLKKWKD